MKKYTQGNAITGIIIIVLILLAGGIYIYQMTKVQNEENRTNAERAAAEQSSSIGLNANVSSSFAQ